MVPVNPARRSLPARSSISRLSLDKSLPPAPKDEDSVNEKSSLLSPNPRAVTTVLVGSKQRPFQVNMRLLCEVSPFFRDRLEDSTQSKPVSLWLPSESTTMFALFVEWVHAPHSFRSFLDCALNAAYDASPTAFNDLHWAIIRLHLFAAHLTLHQLQDLAMDSIQDLYLRCNWDVPASLVVYLYTKCEALPAVRIRRWVVAMVAFSTPSGSNLQLRFHPQDSSTSDTMQFRALLDSLPEFASDYGMHLRNMRASGLDTRFKNPQLRIAANKLRNDQRLFGFRECSFHSHRAAVGEAPCPHSSTGRLVRRHTVQSMPELEQNEEVLFGLTISRNEQVRRSRPEPLITGTIHEEDEEAEDQDENEKPMQFYSQLSPVR